MSSPEWRARLAIELAQANDRLEFAASEVRFARLKQAAELERQGLMDEAAEILALVRAEQSA